MKKIYKKTTRQYHRLLRSIKFIINHPLTQGEQACALKRYLLFHIIGRLLPGPVLYPYISDTQFVAQPGMAGIVGNIYTGLDDFEEKGFMLHFLREGDLFVDVGANVGAYTILASGVCKAQTIAIEPIPSTVDLLSINLRLNDLKSVEVYNCGIGSSCSELYFTNKHDVLNHVVLQPNEYSQELIRVKVFPLDDILEKRNPILLKIDVEGFEFEVIRGATKSLQNEALQAIIIEMQGHENRYENTYGDVHNILIKNRFYPFVYDPINRTFKSKDGYNLDKFNTIYLRNTEFVQRRVEEASSFKVLNKTI